MHVPGLPQVNQAEAEAAHRAELSGRDAALAAARGHAEGLDANLSAALAKHAVSAQVPNAMQSHGIRGRLIIHQGRQYELIPYACSSYSRKTHLAIK